jgi:hypothetical protein
VTFNDVAESTFELPIGITPTPPLTPETPPASPKTPPHTDPDQTSKTEPKQP